MLFPIVCGALSGFTLEYEAKIIWIIKSKGITHTADGLSTFNKSNGLADFNFQKVFVQATPRMTAETCFD